MNIIIIILSVLGGLIALILLVALFMRKDYHVRSEIVINVPIEKVFDYIRLLKNQDHFNKWVMVDPDMKKEFSGTDGTVGFVYRWSESKKAGEGEQEITGIEDHQKIATEIRFVKPFAAIAQVSMTTEKLSEHQTKVTWSNDSTMSYPINIMVPMVEKMLPKDMAFSLNNLKDILEK